MPVSSYLDTSPELGEGGYLHETAQMIGDVRIGRDSSVWCNTVLRGDVNRITIGECSNVQDFSMGHVSHQNPAKRVRRLIDEEIAYLKYSAEHYVRVKNNYTK